MGIKEALVDKLLQLGEKETAEAGENALARGAAKRAAIETSEAAGQQAVKGLSPDKLDPKYDQISYQPKLDEINAAENAGFSDKNSKLGPMDPMYQTPEFQMVGAPRTEVPAGSQNFTMKDTPYSGSGNLPVEAGGSNLPSVNSAPGNPQMSNWDHIMAAAKENKLPISLGLGATGLGALAMNGNDTSQSKFGPKDLLVSKPKAQDAKEEAPEEDDSEDEDSDEEDKDTGGKNSPAPKIDKQKSKAQSLSDLLSAQEPDKENFKDVQRNKNLAVLANQLGSAGDLIGGSLAKVGPNQTAQGLFANNIKNAENITNDYKDRKAMEEQDPNSAVSQNYRKFLEKYGVNAGPGVTAAQVKGVLLPAAEKEQLKQMQIDAQHENKLLQLASIKATKEQSQAMREQTRQDKLDKDNVTRIDKAGKLITAEVASSRSPFGRAGNTYQSAEKIETLANSMNPNDLDQRQITEIARNLDGMLSNGQPTVSGMNKLLPASARGSASKIAEYIMNLPKGAQQGEFVTRMMDTVRREKDLADTQMRRTQGKLLSSYADLKDHPNMQSVLRQNGIPDDIFEPPVTLSTAEKKQVLDFAKTHNMSVPDAEALILKRKKEQDNAEE